MPHKLRKTRKKRGSRTVGYGRVGQHRGGGQRGGHGKAGRHKHLWSYILRYEPNYFQKKGFHPPRRSEVRIINAGDIDEKVETLLAEGKATKRHDGIQINLEKLGYQKLLGGGKVRHPLIVEVGASSKAAAHKIAAANGRILGTGGGALPAPSSDEEPAVERVPGAGTLVEVRGIGPKRAQILGDAGVDSIETLAQCKPKELAQKTGISEKIVSAWIKNAAQSSNF